MTLIKPLVFISCFAVSAFAFANTLANTHLSGKMQPSMATSKAHPPLSHVCWYKNDRYSVGAILPIDKHIYITCVSKVDAAEGASKFPVWVKVKLDN